jgi:hypothetical protein
MGGPAGIPDLTHFAAGFAKYFTVHTGKAVVFSRENTECVTSLKNYALHIVSGDIMLGFSWGCDNYLNLSNYLIKAGECGI